MKFKKSLSLILALILISGVFTVPKGAFAENILSKRVLINVAENKPVTSNQTEDSNYPFSNLVDGRKTSFIIPASGMNSAKTEITVDLQRKYKIEKIELHSRYDGAADFLGRQYFELIGANKEDFSDGVVLDYMNEQNDDLFPSSGCFESVQNGKDAYRYVKLKRTGGGYYGYSELKVFAYQTVTEVSKNKTVTTSPGSYTSGDKAVNGTNNNENDGWINDKASEYNYLSIDLGESLPIGMIEMEGRNITTENPATRQNIAVYGSNSADNLTNLTSLSKLSEDDGYEQLLYVGSMSGGYYLYDEFPYGKYPESYCASVDESDLYRFITFRNTTLHASAFGEVRAYVVNPEVLSVTCDEDYLYVNFSDEMNTSEDGISLTKRSDGTVYAGSFEDAYTYVIDISEKDKSAAYDLAVSANVQNAKGVKLAEEYILSLNNLSPVSSGEITFHGSTDGSGSEVDNFYGLTDVSVKANAINNGKSAAKVTAYIALYSNANRLLSLSLNEIELASGESADVIASLSLPDDIEDGMYLKAFIWNSLNDVMIPLASDEKMFADKYNIYVAPYGSDEGYGTASSPFKTIERAKAEVLKRNEEMSQDINVNIAGGTYQLSETLLFDEEDSGNDGYYVNYKAVDGEDVLITGGTKIEGWEIDDAERNIYKASASGFDEIRNLYVNGVSARTARSEGRIKPLDLYYENDKVKGYYVSSSDIGLYENAEDIRLFYTQVWKYTLCNVAEIVESETEGQYIIKMQNKAFSTATSESISLPVTKEDTFYMENAKELLDMPGEFYFDETEDVIYYMASEDEVMEEAEVYVPVLDKLLQIEGSDLGNKVRNIRFNGIHFAHAGRNDIYDGYLGGQAQSRTPIEKCDTSYPLDTTITGGNIRIFRSENIEFINNKFSGLSAVAIGIYEGSNDIVVRGNAFYDIGDSAVTVGLPSDSYMEDGYYDDNGNYLGRNVALYKPVKDANGGSSAISANDGDVRTVWTTNYISNYLQIDLGKEYEISQIRIPARKNYGSNPDAYDDTTLFRRNFKVLGSKYEDFSDGGVVLGQQGSAAFDVSTGFIANTNTTEKFRYIRVQKTVSEHLPLADVIVISPDQTVPVKEVSKRTVIDNNYITRIGEFNLGAPGIQLYYTEGAQVSHNTIKDVPYSGICVGWGWLNTLDSTTAKNNSILNNHIENYAMRTYDAGGVYLLGTQSGNRIENNYMKNQPNAYWALYADSGAENFVAKNNVFEDCDMAFAIGYSYSASGKKNLTILDNYSTTACWSINYTDTNSVVEEPTVYLKSAVPSGAQTIIDASGVEAEYMEMIEDVPCGRWSLSVEDIYGDIIDHHVSYEGGSVGESMPDTTLISYYLSNPLKTARKIRDLGKDVADESAYNALNDAITKATKAETQFKNLGYGYNNTTIAPIDRRGLIDVRLELMAAVEEYVETMK